MWDAKKRMTWDVTYAAVDETESYIGLEASEAARLVRLQLHKVLIL